MALRFFVTGVVAGMVSLATLTAHAQPLGTFTWRLEPYCNLVTVTVTQNGAVYTMDGYDDLCSSTRRAPLVGLATPNPDGTIAIGWNIVIRGTGLHVGARIDLAGLGGTWDDSAGNSGHLEFGTATSGSPRAIPIASTIPAAFSLLADGGFAARGTHSNGTLPASGGGTRMMWHPNKSAFRAGTVPGAEWDDANIGAYSTALGYGTIARGLAGTALGLRTIAAGVYSTALGYQTNATGQAATALGYSTNATGANSIAMGIQSTASGINATAMGSLTVASGTGATATGFQSVASGDYSTATGYQSTASGVSSTAMGVVTSAAAIGSTAMGNLATVVGAADGSFVYGDRSTAGPGNTTARITAYAPNQFLVRAAGGVGFYTNAALTAGVTLASGGSSWSVVSDVNMKEHFREVTDDDVLAAIARMPVRTWSYKTQDAAIRHMGPTAQDFHAAFGLGESDTRINTIDADGVALAAARALEARTRAANDRLTRELDVLRERLAHLERLLATK